MKKLLLPFLVFALFSCSEKKVSTVKPVFNVPALIGKNIDKVRKELGKPVNKEIEPNKLQKNLSVETWENSFEKEGHNLLVTFNPKTREVTDFFLNTDDPTGLASNYEDMVAICGAKEGDENYTIEPVPTIKNKSKYTGIKIIKK